MLSKKEYNDKRDGLRFIVPTHRLKAKTVTEIRYIKLSSLYSP